MSDERRMILQMVADGKVTPEEAERLLQAIDESERSARLAAAEHVREAAESAERIPEIGESIDRAVRESLRGFEQALKTVEVNIAKGLSKHDLESKVEEKVRRAAERAGERAMRIQERASRTAEEAARRAAEQAERMARKLEERIEERQGYTFTKVGIHIDKASVEKTGILTVDAGTASRLELENRVGDIQVEFGDFPQVEVEVKKVVWGSDTQDAEARAEQTVVRLSRHDGLVRVDVERPTIHGIGVLVVKDTRIDYRIRLPRSVALQIRNKVGDVRVLTGEQIGLCDLGTKVGDIQVAVAPNASFTYRLEAKSGSARIDLPETQANGRSLEGVVGSGEGLICAVVKSGEILVRH